MIRAVAKKLTKIVWFHNEIKITFGLDPAPSLYQCLTVTINGIIVVRIWLVVKKVVYSCLDKSTMLNRFFQCFTTSYFKCFDCVFSPCHLCSNVC